MLHAYTWSSVVAVVFLFLVALEGDRRRSVMVGIATAVILAGVLIALIPVLDRGDAVSGAGTRMLAALCALVVGDLVRSRRALGVATAANAERELDELRRRAEGQAVAERLRGAHRNQGCLCAGADDLRGTLDVLRELDTPAARNPALGLAAVPQLLARATQRDYGPKPISA